MAKSYFLYFKKEGKKPILPERQSLLYLEWEGDIEDSNLNAVIGSCNECLYVGHKIVIKTCPKYQCIKAICDNLRAFKLDTEFMFKFETNRIETIDWENTYAAIKYAHSKGYCNHIWMNLTNNPRKILTLLIPFTNKIYIRIGKDVWGSAEEHLKLYEELIRVHGPIVGFADTFFVSIKSINERIPYRIFKQCKNCGEYYSVYKEDLCDPRSYCDKRECIDAFKQEVEIFKQKRRVNLRNFYIYRMLDNEGRYYGLVCPVCAKNSVPGSLFCANHSEFDLNSLFSWAEVRLNYLKANMKDGYVQCVDCGQLIQNAEVHHEQEVSQLNYKNYRLIWEFGNLKIKCPDCHKSTIHSIDKEESIAMEEF